MKCFYHNDADGKCAGFWVGLSAGLNNLETRLADSLPLSIAMTSILKVKNGINSFILVFVMIQHSRLNCSKKVLP